MFRKNQLKTTFYPQLQIVGVTDFCNIRYFSRYKSQGKKQAMLLVHLIIPVVPETDFSRMHEF